MAYDRAERVGVYPCSETGPHVGPDTYNIEVGDFCDCKGQNMAPFLTSARRKLSEAPCSSFVPGPDTYFPKNRRKRVVGGSALKNKARRFKDCGSDYPGPPDYDPAHLLEELAEGEELLHPRVKGYLYHCPVPYTLYGYTPSMPSKNHCGYALDRNKKLTSIRCCIPDETIGPAFYKVRKCKQPYFKGCHWSKSKTKRGCLPPFMTPSPCAYDIEGPPNWAQYEAELIRHMKRKTSNVPRFLDALTCKSIKENQPAPNHYDIGGMETRIKRGKNVQKFNVTADRFCHRCDDVPSPDTYMDPRCALDCLTKPTAVYNSSGFLVTAPRFPCKEYEPCPGPNEYCIKGFADELLAKKSPYARKNCAFNTSNPRDTTTACKDAILNPAPNEYDRCCPPVPCGGLTSSFRSGTRRDVKVGVDYLANCASYNITPSFKLSQTQKSFRKPCRGSFNTTTERFGRVTDFAEKCQDPTFPGPVYDLSSYKPGKECLVGRLPDFECRFKYPYNCSPSPQDHHIHPVYASSVLKRTFNAKLNNPIPLYPDKPDHKTLLRPQKVLRAFLAEHLAQKKEQKLYERQVMNVAKLCQDRVVWDPQFPIRFFENNKKIKDIFEKYHVRKKASKVLESQSKMSLGRRMQSRSLHGASRMRLI